MLQKISGSDRIRSPTVQHEPARHWSHFKSVFRIRIRLDPDSNCHAGSGSVFGIRILKVKLSYKNPPFPQIFHDFHLFLKMIPNKSSMFNKIRYLLDWLKTKIKYLLFGLITKISPKIFFALEKSGIRIRNPDPDWGKSPGSGSVKNESGSDTLNK